MKRTIYLAGGLFNAGQRVHNILLDRELKKLGYQVILPQVEALKFVQGNDFDLKGIAEDCARASTSRGNFFVGCIDGADADSGTCIEFGLAMGITRQAIVYRTDFRTSPEKEVGVNGMFQLAGAELIYLPCFANTLEEFSEYYEQLATAIHERIEKIA